MRVYLSGPMTGLTDLNYPAFHEAARLLRFVGLDVINPAESHGGRRDLPRKVYLKWDIAELMECDGVVALPGWQDSEGCGCEWRVAKALDIPLAHTG